MILQSKLLTLVNEVIGQTAKLRKGGLQATYFCFVCHHYKRKLEVNLETGQWNCWVCHSKGSYLGSLFRKVKASPAHRERLFELTKDVRLHRRKTDRESVELSLPSEFISLANPPKNDVTYSDHVREYRRAISYLKKRGIGIDDICRYNMGYCEEGEYRDCIITPSYDADGKLNYFSSRYYYPHPWLKYKNAPFSKNIVGFECFINYESDMGVTISEGCFDAIAIRNNAIPLFGTIMSTKLKESLVINKVNRVNICLDSDAIKEAIKMYDTLVLMGIPKIHLILLNEKDPSAMGFDKIHNLIENSRSVKMEDVVFQKLKGVL